MTDTEANNYKRLASIDVNKHKKKKGRFTYLSWTYAVDCLLREDPSATWEFHEPRFFNDTVLVSCTVTAFNKPAYMHLAVFDNNNKPIKNPPATAYVHDK